MHTTVWTLVRGKGQESHYLSSALSLHSIGVECCPYRFKGGENGKGLRRPSLAPTVVFGEFQPSLRLLNDMNNMRASSRSQILSCLGLKSALWRVT